MAPRFRLRPHEFLCMPSPVHLYLYGLPSQIYVQFFSRLCASFDYYCQFSKVTDFRSLCDLIVSDRIFETLDRELMTHIAVKQGEAIFKPQQLGRECDVYLSSRGRSTKELINRNAVSEAKRVVGNKWPISNWRADKNISKIFVSETKNINCVLCKRASHSLSACSQFRRLPVWIERKLSRSVWVDS
ncbi:hypothetical protein AVEN_73693-1 [Araneus ventricosus]|uniref:Uncharacterized protein n=1 Tax=Araneus ventricosus TaxID=182803 RepID=A0A4Y2HQM2_ARAVE|nr:hypothetical protein AVEN_73693-1 [Araneus ventricosus]